MSGFNLSSYIERRKLVTEMLGRIADVAGSLGVQTISEAIQTTIDGLNHSAFKVVIVGEFSRGKSTLINALIGKRLLPSSTKPTTTTLNKISFSEAPTFKLHYRDSAEIETIGEEEFKQIVAPPAPIPGNIESEQQHQEALSKISRIAFVDIGYPTDICHEGVEIVDTPGTNDLDAAREEITYKFIPESDAAVVVLSGRQPLADSELRFIKDRILEADIQKIFFVVNFKDYFKTAQDEQKVYQYIKEHLEPIVKEPKVIMLSAKNAMNVRRKQNGEEVKGKIPDSLDGTGFIEFEEMLGNFLMEEKGVVKLSKPIDRGLRFAHQLKQDSIRLSLGTLSIPLEELERKINKLKPEFEQARKVSQQTLNRLLVELKSRGNELMNDLESGLTLIADAAVRTVNNYAGPLTKEDIAREIERTVAPLQTELQSSIRQRMNHVLNDEMMRAYRRLEADWTDFEDHLTTALMVPGNNYPQSSSYTQLGPIQVHMNKDDAALFSGLGTFGIAALASALSISFVFMLPAMFFGGTFLYSHFETKARERALGQVSVQINQRFRDIIPDSLRKFQQDWNRVQDEAINNFKAEIEQKLSVIERQLTTILNERKAEQEKVEQRRQFLQGQEFILNESIEALTDLYNQLQTQKDSWKRSEVHA